MSLSSTMNYLLGVSHTEETPKSGSQENHTHLDTLENIHEARDLGLFSPTLIQQKLNDDTFSAMMLSLQQNYCYVDSDSQEKPIRGTRNASLTSKLNDLRQLTLGYDVVSRKAATKSSDICRSEILKIIKDAIAKDGIDFKSVIREESARSLGYTLIKTKPKLARVIEATSAYEDFNETVTDDAKTGQPEPTDLQNLQKWLSNQFAATNGKIESVQTQINKISADTRKANATADKVEKQVELLNTEVKANTEKTDKTETKFAELETEMRAALEKMKVADDTPIEELELQYKLKMKAHRDRRAEDLRRGMIKIVVKNTTKYAARDTDARNNNNFKPLVKEILKVLNIDEKKCYLHQTRNGREYKSDTESVPLPFLIVEANHGCITRNHETSRTTDHASYIMTNIRARNDDLLISRASNATDQMATHFFARWKAAGVIERFILNRHSLFTLYFSNGEHVIVRVPLILCTLSNATKETIIQANKPGWSVYKGKPKEILKERTDRT